MHRNAAQPPAAKSAAQRWKCPVVQAVYFTCTNYNPLISAKNNTLINNSLNLNGSASNYCSFECAAIVHIVECFVVEKPQQAVLFLEKGGRYYMGFIYYWPLT